MDNFHKSGWTLKKWNHHPVFCWGDVFNELFLLSKLQKQTWKKTSILEGQNDLTWLRICYIFSDQFLFQESPIPYPWDDCMFTYMNSWFLWYMQVNIIYHTVIHGCYGSFMFNEFILKPSDSNHTLYSQNPGPFFSAQNAFTLPRFPSTESEVWYLNPQKPYPERPNLCRYEWKTLGASRGTKKYVLVLVGTVLRGSGYLVSG